jgi:hypothetical protein
MVWSYSELFLKLEVGAKGQPGGLSLFIELKQAAVIHAYLSAVV